MSGHVLKTTYVHFILLYLLISYVSALAFEVNDEEYLAEATRPIDFEQIKAISREPVNELVHYWSGMTSSFMSTPSCDWNRSRYHKFLQSLRRELLYVFQDHQVRDLFVDSVAELVTRHLGLASQSPQNATLIDDGTWSPLVLWVQAPPNAEKNHLIAPFVHLVHAPERMIWLSALEFSPKTNPDVLSNTTTHLNICEHIRYKIAHQRDVCNRDDSATPFECRQRGLLAPAPATVLVIEDPEYLDPKDLNCLRSMLIAPPRPAPVGQQVNETGPSTSQGLTRDLQQSKAAANVSALVSEDNAYLAPHRVYRLVRCKPWSPILIFVTKAQGDESRTAQERLIRNVGNASIFSIGRFNSSSHALISTPELRQALATESATTRRSETETTSAAVYEVTLPSPSSQQIETCVRIALTQLHASLLQSDRSRRGQLYSVAPPRNTQRNARLGLRAAASKVQKLAGNLLSRVWNVVSNLEKQLATDAPKELDAPESSASLARNDGQKTGYPPSHQRTRSDERIAKAIRSLSHLSWEEALATWDDDRVSAILAKMFITSPRAEWLALQQQFRARQKSRFLQRDSPNANKKSSGTSNGPTQRQGDENEINILPCPAAPDPNSIAASLGCKEVDKAVVAELRDALDQSQRSRVWLKPDLSFELLDVDG